MKHLIATLLLALVLAGCASQEATQNDSLDGTVPESPAQTVSAAELASHDSESDCWVVYDGKVYDITSFLPNHAEGNYTGILPLCGHTDDSFKNAFEEQHGTYKVSVLESEGVLKGTLEG